MKQKNFIIIYVIAILLLAGCRSNGNEPDRVFFSNFSIGTVVENNETYLLNEATESSGVNLPGSRLLIGSESGPPEPFINDTRK